MDHTKAEQLSRIQVDEINACEAIRAVSAKMVEELAEDEALPTTTFFIEMRKINSLRNALVGALIFGGRFSFEQELLAQKGNAYLDTMFLRLDHYLTKMPPPR